jgi:RNA polymerase sigma-70 factor (ECF subfamily)
MTKARTEQVLSDPGPSPDRSATAAEDTGRVRAALESLPERERRLLLLRAEGFSYRDLSEVLDLNPASVGTLLARAKDAFREAYGGKHDAS